MKGRSVILCCYAGMVVQAVVCNLAPVLFIPLKEQIGLTYEQLGRLILINFATQVAFDLACGYLVDRLGPKPFVVWANVLAAAGLCLFAAGPLLFRSPYAGLVAGTIVFSTGGGILELLLSPILNALPSESKAADMSLLHSFYAWGQLAVILLTTLALFVFGSRWWPAIAVAWALVPALAALAFQRAPVPRLVEEARRQKLRQLVRVPAFLAAVAAIGLAGATELSLAQWLSAFAERGLGLPKLAGDLGGLCLFALAMGIGRAWFGARGARIDVRRTMLAGAALAAAAYLVASLSPWPLVSLAACIAAGLAVSPLWPGMLSVAASRFPLAGASMFALMSASGDTGGAVAPWLVGVVSDAAQGLARAAAFLPGAHSPEQQGLRIGLLAAALCPLLLLALLRRMRFRPEAED